MDLLGLADVCSIVLKGMTGGNESPSKASNLESKKAKSQNAMDFTCTDDIRNLNSKNLVEKFSESTADELKRRYSYRCAILPDECDKVFESYGSEKRAYDNMKQHLQIHLHDLEERILNKTWPPEHEKEDQDISDSKSNLKSCKKALKSQHLCGIKLPTKRKMKAQNKQSKTPNTSPPRKEKRLNGIHKSNSKMFGSISPSNPKKVTPSMLSKSSMQGYTVVLEEAIESKEEKMIVEEIVQDSTIEICGPLCTHVNCSLSLPSTSKADLCKSNVSPGHVSKTNVSSLKNVLLHSISLEHSYATVDGVKLEKPASESVKPSRRIRGCRIPQQLIIRTPPFPYVHVPLLPDCAGVEEIGLLCSSNDGKRSAIDCSSDTRESNGDNCIDGKTSSMKVKRVMKRYKKHTISSSVLECVENRVDMNASTIRLPNNQNMSPEHNIENTENLQKAERERAIRYIAKLKSKKKKYQGPLECKICVHKTFTAQATLIHHYRSHAGIKPYACKLCDSTFTRKHSLNYHMLIHKNISRFACLHCDRVFRHPSHFKEHLRRHTGETPFMCSTCLLKFKTRNTFKRHLKVQHQKLLTTNGHIVDIPTVAINNE